MKAGDEPVDVLPRIVERERDPCSRGNAETIHHRLRAVVPGADRDSLLIQNGPDVVGMDPLEHDGKDARLEPRLPDDPESGNRPELHRPVVEELLLLRADKVEVDLVQVVK
jgi:hypothetical protein